jgi:hypothetical protein
MKNHFSYQNSNKSERKQKTYLELYRWWLLPIAQVPLRTPLIHFRVMLT